MAMFVKQRKSTKSKLQEFMRLCTNVRATRKTLSDAEAKITCQHKEYNLDGSNSGTICINRFAGVMAKSLSAHTLDDNGLVEFCDKYDCHHLCENNNCAYEELNWDAVAAQIGYDAAIQERCDFVRGFFGISRKGK